MMNQPVEQLEASTDHWRAALSVESLQEKQVVMQRIDERQIAFFLSGETIRACDNRCPHEGYPLSEGSLSSDGVLTCNWHNWKFCLANGENLYGGDQLRVYPVEIRQGMIWIDISDPPYHDRYDRILNSLHDAFDDYSYDRIAREVARLIKLGADPVDALRESVIWSWQKLEFGWSHCYAGMADWIKLYDEAADDEVRLVCLTESIAYVAYDVLREPEYPFDEAIMAWNEPAFLQAIEGEDESAATAMVRGGLAAGMRIEEFESALSHAALAHYNDFGHSLIYVTKIKTLVDRLGEVVLQPLLLSLVRNFIFASREDKIPEFRAYDDFLEQWDQAGGERSPAATDWQRTGISKAMQLTVESARAPVEPLYRALLMANARHLLQFDIDQQYKTHVSVSGNVGWLDFTHGLTFANAVHEQCTRFPELWPQGLLQMACFIGRNSAYTLEANQLDEWRTDDVDSKLGALIEAAINHGQGEHIVAVHLLKTALSVRDEIRHLDHDDAVLMVAALTRFFESPLKRRQPRRTAFQSLQFVARE